MEFLSLVSWFGFGSDWTGTGAGRVRFLLLLAQLRWVSGPTRATYLELRPALRESEQPSSEVDQT